MGGNGKVKEGQQTLQEIFAQLDEVIAGMEQEEVSLEETFELYHKGMDMLKLCNERIDKVEKKMLLLDNEGEEHEFES
ncbi:exodeoxyribonuclease VII, small subunit [Lachnospiraceae bacterium MD308]|jgi:Exonuclease VII small subunit|nr:exodeoxyribonuclease VII, small subunit [Lachnospiraceae bacterium MD308]MCI8503796.1 exodeoxyribonuclease VII small subunit [Dorea sp.]